MRPQAHARVIYSYLNCFFRETPVISLMRGFCATKRFKSEFLSPQPTVLSHKASLRQSAHLITDLPLRLAMYLQGPIHVFAVKMI